MTRGYLKGSEPVAMNEFEISTKTYIFAGIGAILFGGMGAALGDPTNAVSAAIIGALGGGMLAFFLR
jgi:outer membrane lipoprotein SlyB